MLSPFLSALQRCHLVLVLLVVPAALLGPTPSSAQNRYATSDSLSGYVHWIDLYDSDNRKIDPSEEFPRPYSPENTCGRCHEFDTISHGWHFNAVEAETVGRRGQPWIWSDGRTGTHLPLSYRGWEGTHDPDALGISRWQVTAKFGGFLPGGGPGSREALAAGPGTAGSETESRSSEDAIIETDSANPEYATNRTAVTGPLMVDCMLCHHAGGSGYSPFTWTEQVEEENFAYAPTAALGIAVVRGSVRRLKNDFDPNSSDAVKQLPKVRYESSRFRGDGKVFFDLVRKPQNDACYYCHTNVSTDVTEGGRWLHDEDVHVRAGLACADCHRNSLDHHTVRGYDGEQHPSGVGVTSLSCQGCHMPPGDGNQIGQDPPGRLGAPRPAHHGLPPLHFEKMTCTACHSGPAPSAEVERQFNSIAHQLGKHTKRTGDEFPGIVSPVPLIVTDETGLRKYTPHRMMWPSYWAIRTDDAMRVLHPEQVHQLTRKSLRVRQDFTEELAEVKLSLSARRDLLGEKRGGVQENDWTMEEVAKLTDAEQSERRRQVEQRIAAALGDLETAFPGSQAVYVSGGAGFVRDTETTIEAMPADQLGDAAEPYAWPLAHNVRPARQSLGSSGCLECHSDESLFFSAEVQPIGLLPDQPIEPIKVSSLQGVDTIRLSAWNRLFAGRSWFKVLGLIALGLTSIVVLTAVTANLSRFVRKPPIR